MVGLLRLARNEGFRIVVLSWFCDLFAVGTIGAMLPYYVGYVLLDPQVAITLKTLQIHREAAQL